VELSGQKVNKNKFFFGRENRGWDRFFRANCRRIPFVKIYAGVEREVLPD
jgi:hypothetical protein